MRATDKYFSVPLHLDQANLKDIQLDSDRRASFSVVMKRGLWLAANTKLNRSKTITNKKAKTY